MIERPVFNSQIITATTQMIGKAEPVGPWLSFLNNRDKFNLLMRDARIMSLTAGVAPVDRPEIFVNRNLASMVVLLDAGVRDSMQMMRNVIMAIMHIGPIICRGEIHIGADTPLGLYFDDLPGNFFPVTNASLHSVLPMPAPLPRQSELLLINRTMVQTYYAA